MAACDRLPSAPEAFAERVALAFGLAGPTTDQLDTACTHLESLVDETLERLV